MNLRGNDMDTKNQDKYRGMMLDGRYELVELIGSGGMAVVYKAMCHRLNRYVAVKIMRPELAKNEKFRRRFQTESQAIAKLSHPNIVGVYDVSRTDHVEYIVMELVDGITLKQYLQDHGPLDAVQAVDFSLQIARALAHAHGKGIVHRDIKPQNILVVNDGVIKVADFGIANLQSEVPDVENEAIGSVHYISPEQARGLPVDGRSDIYSLGIVMYEMLSGKLPFDGTGAVSIAIMQISEKPKPLAEVAPNIPVGLRQITEKAMEKDPADRYQSAQEMLDAIAAFRRDPSISFEYEYNTQDNPDKTINRVVSSSTAKTAGKAAVSTSQARRAGTMNSGKGKNVKKQKAKAAKGFSMLPIFFGMAVAFVIGAAILVYLIFTNSTNSFFSKHADVQLINFVGMTEDEFRASDYNSSLLAKWVYEYNDAPEGTIFQQNPKQGRTVKAGQKVTLKVSLGTQWVTVPDVKTYVSDDAKKTLQDSGLQVVSKYVEDESVAAGTVVYTEPAGGETVEGGSTVNMYIARSKRDNMVSVTSVTGLQVSEGTADLQRQNLVVSVVEQPSSEAEGTILNQEPAAGTQVRIRSTVRLYVATAMPEVVQDPSTSDSPSSGDGARWSQEITDDNGNTWWVDVEQRDGHVYRVDTGEMLW